MFTQFDKGTKKNAHRNSKQRFCGHFSISLQSHLVEREADDRMGRKLDGKFAILDLDFLLHV